MANEDYRFAIITRKEKRHKLITKCIEILGSEFTLNDLLTIESLSWNEKKELKNLFGGDYSNISGHDFSFEKKDGKWTLIESKLTWIE